MQFKNLPYMEWSKLHPGKYDKRGFANASTIYEVLKQSAFWRSRVDFPENTIHFGILDRKATLEELNAVNIQPARIGDTLHSRQNSNDNSITYF